MTTNDTQKKSQNMDEMLGLEFKSKPYRKWMKEYFQRQEKSFGFKNSHYVMSVVDQILTFNLLNGMSESFKKTNHGFYDVKLEDMQNYIRLTPHLNNTFNFVVSRYDEHMDYMKQLCVDKKIFDKYITKCVFHDNFRINLNNQSMNFLTYLLVQTNTLLSNTAMHMVTFANKKSISDNAIICSLKIHFSGKILDDILKKCDSVITLLKNKDKEDSEKGEGVSKDNKSKDNKSTEKSEKSDNKETEKDSDKEESDKEESDKEESEKEDSEEESESESESETEPEPEPVKNNKKPQKKVVSKKK